MARRDRSEPDLFSVDPSGYLPLTLSSMSWPPGSRFPINHSTATVRQQVRGDLVASPSPLVVAGFSSVVELIELCAAWSQQHCGGVGVLRIVLGSEPFATSRTNFASSRTVFTDDVRRYWLEQQGVSLRASAKVIAAIELIKAGRVRCRFVDGDVRLHAKIYAAARSVTVGSSNFTLSGLSTQIEANTRFEAADDPDRYHEGCQIAENYYTIGDDWNTELVELLESLLAFVSWQEALAKACADLLDGEWAERYLANDIAARALWPSQRLGIAQALWITENVGSVLVADATGSGKTRMGAHLVRSVRDRLWSTGRVKRDLTVLVAPPAVKDTWLREAVSCGLTMIAVSHGVLSRNRADNVPRIEQDAVRDAQILAVDEAHNFLGRDTNRTRHVRDSLADHVLLFTATPINRGASDLLQLVGLLGADNFDDATLDILDRLDRRRSSSDSVLNSDEAAVLRREIQRFTVRRTKTTLNSLVDADPDAYRNSDGRVCRYPTHDPHTYITGETDTDAHVAEQIRAITATLAGVTQLEQHIEVPAALRRLYDDERWLQFRLGSCQGLAAHHVLGAMRSSRAAVVEHIAGTTAAVAMYDLTAGFKSPTGNTIGKLDELAANGPPTVNLDCELPDWLGDIDAWQQRCTAERDRYRQILALTEQLSDARELTKARLLVELFVRHDRILAFDHHLITLEVLQPLIDANPKSETVEVIIATGADKKNRKRVEKVFALDSTTRSIALCSDAMNEGLNLQGASAIVHLDLPTTLRVAEQRVGRVDRMDSPHDLIEAWWPKDGPAFATRANERLAQRAAESGALLGSNLPIPNLHHDAPDMIVDVTADIEAAEAPGVETWDGISDALDPIRNLVTGTNPLIDPARYDTYRHTQRVVARVSPLHTDTPWVFFAIAGTAHGAPRWLLLQDHPVTGVIELDTITQQLRQRLTAAVTPRVFDDTADAWLTYYLDHAASIEHQLLPRRLQRALKQMTELAIHWADTDADVNISQRWRTIAALADTSPSGHAPDLYVVAQTWCELVAPILDAHRHTQRRNHYTRLHMINPTLRTHPLDIDHVEAAFAGLRTDNAPLDRRVTACIIGVPDQPPPRN